MSNFWELEFALVSVGLTFLLSGHKYDRIESLLEYLCNTNSKITKRFLSLDLNEDRYKLTSNSNHKVFDDPRVFSIDVGPVCLCLEVYLKEPRVVVLLHSIRPCHTNYVSDSRQDTNSQVGFNSRY